MRALVFIALLAACDSDAGDTPRAVCGDGVTEELEACDDGNLLAGDGCNAACETEAKARLSWAFYPVLGGPEQAGCRAGVAVIETVSEAGATARFPCDDARTATVFAGPTSRVFARLRAANDDIIAESVPMRVFERRVAAPFYEDAGYLRLVLPMCGPDFTLTLTPLSGTPIEQTVACENVAVELLYSQPIRAGTYDVMLQSPTLSEGRIAVEIGTNNRVTELSFLD